MNPEPTLRHDGPPFLRPQPKVQRVMSWVLLALFPVFIFMTVAFGINVLRNAVLCIGGCWLAEAIAVWLRRHELRMALLDVSVTVTGALLALALPPTVPFWIPLIAAFSAVWIGKHLFGGLGQNIFNPAMTGFAIVLLSFPAAFTDWPLLYAFEIQLSGTADTLSAATPLSVMQTEFAAGQMMSEMSAQKSWSPQLTTWQLINFLALLGGVLLIWRGTIRWQLPLAVLLGVLLTASILYVGDSSQNASPWLHLLTGSTMLAAFFIATDPVTAANRISGQWIYGLGIGFLIVWIRTHGPFPDGVAFAVLMMNATVPLIDHFTEKSIMKGRHA
ncbi:MAG: RnfABCDGE type electron transport complex subunit D [Gammaproteobacteria bacterium]|nr:RnfABCDGE type electron transport complex subunit D [Gammaproteobacteria bacterium]